MDIREFCDKTNLKLRAVENAPPGLFAECSGKEPWEIRNLIRHYNNTNPVYKAVCWDDEIKDVTYIQFIR